MGNHRGSCVSAPGSVNHEFYIIHLHDETPDRRLNILNNISLHDETPDQRMNILNARKLWYTASRNISTLFSHDSLGDVLM